jgi:hypothetical protein
MSSSEMTEADVALFREKLSTTHCTMHSMSALMKGNMCLVSADQNEIEKLYKAREDLETAVQINDKNGAAEAAKRVDYFVENLVGEIDTLQILLHGDSSSEMTEADVALFKQKLRSIQHISVFMNSNRCLLSAHKDEIEELYKANEGLKAAVQRKDKYGAAVAAKIVDRFMENLVEDVDTLKSCLSLLDN